MVVRISCPRCNQPVNPESRHCDLCGVDLALAAIAAEHAIPQPIQLPVNLPRVPEALVPRLGEYLIEKGILAQEGLQHALIYQEEMAAAGKPVLIGQALLDLGLISRAALDEAITDQILQLQTALHKTNQQLEQRVEERTIELQRAFKKLTELNQLKSNFLANISHELRTPLTHLKGYLDILADESLGPLTRQQAEALAVLKRSESRLERLIDDLIRFAQAARGELSVNPSPFDLSKLIDQVLAQSMAKAREKQVSVMASLPQELPFVHADQEKINWVLMQLLDNAIKFTPEKGRVRIDAQVDGNIVSVGVNDTGIGIPPERVNEIFEPFHQLDGSVTRRYAGTGLGLAMVRRILEAHGLAIKVESVNGKGSRFEFPLPIAGHSHARRNP